jgi:hypothetical protein
MNAEHVHARLIEIKAAVAELAETYAISSETEYRKLMLDIVTLMTTLLEEHPDRFVADGDGRDGTAAR